MSFSYSSDPSTSALDYIRWRIGDRVAPGHFSNEEILGSLALAGGVVGQTCYNLLIAWATEEAHLADFTIGRFSETHRTIYQALQVKAAEVASEFGLAVGPAAGIYAGGISVADKAAKEADTDRVGSFFRRGMHDFPGTSSDSSDATG